MFGIISFIIERGFYRRNGRNWAKLNLIYQEAAVQGNWTAASFCSTGIYKRTHTKALVCGQFKRIEDRRNKAWTAIWSLPYFSFNKFYNIFQTNPSAADETLKSSR